jgi:hypothetical protein
MSYSATVACPMHVEAGARDPHGMEILVVRDPLARRLLAAGIGLAAIVWAVSIGFSERAADASAPILGFGAGEWRALLNPAVATVLIGGLATLPARSPAAMVKSAASILILAGLTLVLVGNLAEFGLLGATQSTAGLGRVALTSGALLGVIGIGGLVAAAVPLRGRRQALRVSLAAVTTLIGLGVAVAVPAAAAMLATGLMDALLTRGTSTVGAPHEPMRLPAGAVA